MRVRLPLRALLTDESGYMRARQRGFTIVELLVVDAIIGLLATIALPRFAATKQRAIMASMLSDLKTLVSAQEGFYSSYREYAGGVTALEVPGPGAGGRAALQLSPGNEITVELRSGSHGAGWTATVTNPAITDPSIDECSIRWASSYSPNAKCRRKGLPPATREGPGQRSRRRTSRLGRERSRPTSCWSAGSAHVDGPLQHVYRLPIRE